MLVHVGTLLPAGGHPGQLPVAVGEVYIEVGYIAPAAEDDGAPSVVMATTDVAAPEVGRGAIVDGYAVVLSSMTVTVG